MIRIRGIMPKWPYDNSSVQISELLQFSNIEMYICIYNLFIYLFIYLYIYIHMLHIYIMCIYIYIYYVYIYIYIHIMYMQTPHSAACPVEVTGCSAASHALLG